MTHIVRKFHQQTSRTGHREIHAGENPHSAPEDRLPHITMMLALAIRLEHLINAGIVNDQDELGHVSRARITQIMNLLNLAPEIQEEILFHPRIERGRDRILEREIREVAMMVDWEVQRDTWAE